MMGANVNRLAGRERKVFANHVEALSNSRFERRPCFIAVPLIKLVDNLGFQMRGFAEGR